MFSSLAKIKVNLPLEVILRMTRLFLVTLLAAMTLVAAPLAHAAYLLPGGDFESSDLFGWQASSNLGGLTEVVFQGSCFSGNDTTGIT